MPTRPSKNVKGIYLEIEPQMLERMRELASRNGRSFREEAAHAFTRHLAAPPTVRVVVEESELPPTEVDREKRGRKRSVD